MNERGQALPLLVIVVLAFGGATFALARFGASITQVARSQSSADAAALAAAAEGRDAAEELARDNGAALVAFDAAGAEIEVRAQVGPASSLARARRTGGGGVLGWVGVHRASGVAATMAPALRDALAASADLLHQPVPIASASGRSVDVPRSFASRLAGVAARVGLCRLPSQADPVRFVLCPDSRT